MARATWPVHTCRVASHGYFVWIGTGAGRISRIAEQHSEGRRSAKRLGTGTRRTQKVLMVAEIALSFVLFIGAALLVKSFHQLTAIRPGFDPHGVLTANVALPLDQYQTPDRQRAFFEQLVPQLRALPGVASAAATATVPLRRDTQMILMIQVEGQLGISPLVANVPTARRIAHSVDRGTFTG
jgi:hypothetical protein